MATTTITVTIQKRGRKWFSVVVGETGRAASLLANDVTAALEPRTSVLLRVYDASDCTQYGCRLIFDPIEIISYHPSEYHESKKWLRYAEADAADGKFETNAIRAAVNIDRRHLALKGRINSLIKKIDENRSIHEKKKAMRALFKRSETPELQLPILHNFQAVVFESLGKSFHRNATEYVYVYYRHATNEEIENHGLAPLSEKDRFEMLLI